MNTFLSQSPFQKSICSINSYRLNNLFVDCYLKSGDQMFPCHRIVLASKSQYFFDYFKSHSVNEVELPIDPQNFFINVLDFLYTGDIHLNSKNIALACKISEFYKIDCLENLINLQFNNIISNNNFLQISKTFKDIGIGSKDMQISKIIFNDFLDRKLDNIHQIYSSISPNVLAQILINFDKSISDKLKVKLIEDYLEIQGTFEIKEKDKEALASTINWLNPDSYKYIIYYKCNWVPSKIIRSKINQILQLRRSLIQNCANDFDLVPEKISKFYPLVKICEIGNPDIKDENDHDITYFLSTFGGIVDEFNIFQYGFIQIQSSNYLSEFYPHFIFDQNDDQHYFLSIGNDNANPFLTFSFGKDTKFFLTQIEVQTSRPHIYQGQTASPNKLLLECFDENYDKNQVEKVELNTLNGFLKIQLHLNQPFQYYRIRMADPDPIHSWVLRLLSIKIYGRFESH